MKILLSYAKFAKRVGRVNIFDFHLYGLPYLGPTNMFEPSYEDELFDIVAQHPHMHIASISDDFDGVNFHVSGSPNYWLCEGDANPDLELSDEETSKAIAVASEEEVKAYYDMVRRILNEDFDPVLYQTIVNRAATKVEG